MSAQPAEAFPPRRVVRIAKTVSAVRAALPADRRVDFQAEIESTPLHELAGVLEAWWMRAVVLSDPESVAAFEEARAGTLRTVPIEEVFGERWAAALRAAA